ncbi:MAG: hypothetical protein DMF84_30965 [Acidobacteria bacterium]|nr:MAG: hypothetical protein DMF84_30965 [Acidobacteriota bacterium]TMM27845.1 MAG: hypothetical protein E6F94_01080 [Actinomycetota bacterium]
MESSIGISAGFSFVRRCLAVVVFVGGLLPAAIGASVWNAGASPAREAVTQGNSRSPCGGRTAPARYRHVIWIIFENQSYDHVIANGNLPFTNALAKECGLATDYFGVGDPSLPNYIAMTSGGTWGVNGDSSPPLPVPSIFSQVRARGLSWRTYSESMPSKCYLTDYPNRDPVYTAHHEPVLFYSRVRSDCRRWDVPLGTLHTGALARALSANTLPALAIIGPNDDGGTVKPGCSRPCGNVDPPLSDVFLRSWTNRIVASRGYRSGKTAIFVTWDEDDSFSGGLCPSLHCDHLATIVVAPSVRRNTRSAAMFTHYSLLRTTEELLGLRGRLGEAATAKSMAAPFHLLVARR